jgi:hypothetical protein
MAWIKLHQSVVNHRKVLAVADALDVPEVLVIGHLTCFWLWALDNATDGALAVSPGIVARAAQWRGPATEFVAALVTAGLLEQTDDGYHIHDWDEHAGSIMEKRQANAERMRGARQKREGEQLEHVQRTCGARAGARVEKSRVDNTNTGEHSFENSASAQADAAGEGEGIGQEPDMEDYVENCRGSEWEVAGLNKTVQPLIGDKPFFPHEILGEWTAVQKSLTALQAACSAWPGLDGWGLLLARLRDGRAVTEMAGPGCVPVRYVQKIVERLRKEVDGGEHASTGTQDTDGIIPRDGADGGTAGGDGGRAAGAAGGQAGAVRRGTRRPAGSAYDRKY